MILTLTVNPAVDKNVTADHLVFEDRAYILSRSESAGGRGINASCVIHSFGGATAAIVPSGGKAGARFEQLLAGCGFPVHVVRIKHEIRTNLTISDKTGLTVKLNELGPPMTKPEIGRLEAMVSERLAGASWLLICGSLPPAVSPGLYSRLVAMARERGVKTLLDTDGEPLREGVEAGPAVVAPNQQEAERLLNRALITRGNFIEAVERLRLMGAESVILSLGSRGAMGAFQGKLLEAIPPRVEVVCPIGAGDALVAAFAWAMSQKGDFADALRWAVAAGTASAMLPGVAFATLDQTREIYQRVEVRAIS
ncbi:MAG TPA: 1-phosphofructokinase family hexose kinase [Bryobacteraceae bacterium]|nr:1-phosphofructokinase family hexose kinase [Bryobacteraceae bacterium]